MGAQLVAQVLQYWTHLNDTSFRILLRMAHTALDKQNDNNPPDLYFGGHELLARTLRRKWPEGESEEAKRAQKNILRDVRRATKELVEVGAIEVVATSRRVQAGHSQTYRLLLSPFSRGGVLTPSSAGGENPSSVGGEKSPQQGVRTPPRKDQEPSQDSWEEDGAGVVPQAGDARGRVRQPHPFQPDAVGDSCQACYLKLHNAIHPRCPECGTAYAPDGICYAGHPWRWSA